MVMEEPPEINPPSGRVPGQELLLIPILESRRWRNSKVYREKGSSSRVSGTGVKIGPKGGTGGGPTGPGGQRARPRGAWARGGPPPRALLASGVFRRKRFLGIFLEFAEHFDFSPFSAMHEQKQTKTGTGH